MKRAIDLLILFVLLIPVIIIIVIIGIIIKINSKGPVFYWSNRIGKNNVIFKMPKLRSMRLDTPVVASNSLDNPESYLSPIGGFLRRTSIDELPQLLSVLRGDMSFVGPRPALFNQEDLIALRITKGVDKLLPGITGWAQINGRDIISIPEKVALDVEYMHRQSFLFDIKILCITFIKVIKRVGIYH